MLNWHRHEFCSVPPWLSMIGRVVMFIKCLCLEGVIKAADLRRCCVSGTGSALKLEIRLARLSS